MTSSWLSPAKTRRRHDLILSQKTRYTRSSDRAGMDLKQILLFLLLAFLMPLICVILIKDTSIPRSSVFTFLLFGLEAASPSLAAILTVLLFEAGPGLRKFLKRCYVDHFNWKVVLIGLLLPAVTIFSSELFYGLLFGVAPIFRLLSPGKAVIVSWALVAEELGWRGFLQDKLDFCFGQWTLPFFLGIIWASWHYHFFLSGEMSAPILLFTLGCIADSYLYCTFTKAVHGNIVPASVLHFSENLFLNLLMINPEYHKGSSIPYLLYVTGFLIAAAISFAVTLKCKKKTRS